MPMKKKSVSKETRFRISLVDMIKSDDPVNYLSTARLSIEPQDYVNLISQIEKYPSKLTNLLGSIGKKEYHDLDFKNLLPIPFENELTWAKTILFRNAKSINSFIEKSKQYSKNLLSGNFDSANKILDDIENKFGQSIWLIKNRIAFLQLTEGLESQKKYTQKVKNELRDSSLVKFVIHWVSIRNENKTTLSKFKSQFEPLVDRLDPIKLYGYKDYCNYHVLGFDSLQPEEFVSVLRLEYSRSLIDYYEAFISMLRITFINSEPKLQSKVRFILEAKPKTIKDMRLDFFNTILFDKKILEVDNNLIEASNAFFEGKYVQSYNNAYSTLTNEPDNPLLILIAAYSKAMLSQKDLELDEKAIPIYSLIINNLSEIISKGPIKAIREVTELNKISINFNCFPWSSVIDIVLSQETNILLKENVENAISVLRIPQLHPLLLEQLRESSVYDTYLNVSSLIFKNTITLGYALSKIEESNHLSTFKLGENSQNLLSGLLYFKKGDYKNAIHFGKTLVSSDFGYFTRKGMGIVTYSYLKEGDIKNACKSSTDYFFQDKTIFSFLPLEEMFNSIITGTDEWDEICSLIDFSILLDVYVKNIDIKRETERRFAYEDFLNKHGIKRPSELRGIKDLFTLEKLIYYLKYICIEANMDTSSSFEGGSKEILSERILVCKLLNEIDNINSEDYQREINELVRRQIITSRRLEVDQSRIYIDISSVKEWVIKNVEESYDRYLAYRKHGLEFGIDKPEFNKKIISALPSLGTLPNMVIPDDEVNGLLEEIVLEIVSAYLSPEFGLDRFLSTRIRHGILEGHLRKPIAQHNLITKKEFKQGPYLPNKYWLSKFTHNGNGDSEKIDKLLSGFSLSYDNLILKITSEWLQIRSKKKPKGLFNFNISEVDITNIAAIIKPDTSFDEFIDIVIHQLETVLIFKLAEIRKELYEKAKPEAKFYLKKLQDDIFKYNKTINIAEINASINQARTDMQAQFDKVIEWFVPSASGNSSPFAIEDAMRVAETIIVEASPLFKIEITEDESGDFLIHGNLPIFVDIFVNIFDNVVKRSGLDIPLARCKIWVNSNDPELNLVHFKISNGLSSDKNLETLEIDLKRKREILSSEDYTKYVASEGNSGLFKIHKSISEFRAVGYVESAEMDFGIESDQFQITICVPFRIFNIEMQDED